MPQLIQRSPLGLLSLLDSKAGGRAPNELSDTVYGFVDFGPLYGISVRDKRTLAILAASVVLGYNLVGSGNGIIPAGETWHLLNLTVTTNNVVGAFSFAPGYADSGSRFNQVAPTVTAAAGQRPSSGAELDIWLGPGTQFGAWVSVGAAQGDLIVTPHFERYTL